MDIFSHKVRVRVCGIHLTQAGILLLKHDGLGPGGYIWSPPGGGVEFGESLEDALVKEFAEETGLDIIVKDYLFANEYIDSKHHAIELFFSVEHVGGNLKLGFDPELNRENQILSDIGYLNDRHIAALDVLNLHNIFRHCHPASSILELRGLFKIRNN